MKKIMFCILCCLLLTACNNTLRPYHQVWDGKFVVYHVEQRQSQSHGKYEYWVRDGSSKGWTYISDDVFSIGDELLIIKK